MPRNSPTGTIKLAQDLAKLVNNRQGSDVQFRVGGGANGRNANSMGETIIHTSAIVTMYAHSAILSCRSPHFAALFQNEPEWKERSGGVIHIPDVLPIVFETILEYIYTGNVNIKAEYLLELIAATEEMEIEELRIECQDVVMDALEQAFDEKNEAESHFGEAHFLEQQRLIVVVAVREILIPGLKLAHSLNLRKFFQKLSDFTGNHMEFILASPETWSLFIENIPTQIFAQIILQQSIAIFKMKIISLSISPLLKEDIILEYQRLSENGDIPVLSRLGLCWQHGFGVEQNYFKAAECFIKAAEAGDTDAEYSLGFCYYNGHGVNKDYSKAIGLYTKATKAGNTYAQNSLGTCYYNGHGVFKDYTKAVELYTKPAEAGNIYAQNNLGRCYFNGYGVTKDLTKAIELFTKAAEAGNISAQNNLGFCYENSLGVTKNYTKAIELYTKAAQSGNAQAQNNLAACYENGRGVAKDYVRAIQLYTKAAEAGDTMAQRNLVRLRKLLETLI